MYSERKDDDDDYTHPVSLSSLYLYWKEMQLLNICYGYGTSQTSLMSDTDLYMHKIIKYPNRYNVKIDYHNCCSFSYLFLLFLLPNKIFYSFSLYFNFFYDLASLQFNHTLYSYDFIPLNCESIPQVPNLQCWYLGIITVTTRRWK